jgi:putative serine protease PepD
VGLVAAAVATVGLAAGTGWAGGTIAAGRADGTDGIQQVAASPVSATTTDDLDVAAIVEQLAGSVVSVDTELTVRRGPFEQQGQGAGTGVVIDDSGLIVTNAHVVEGATSVTVSLDSDDEPREATVVASDTDQDLAVLRVEDAEGLVPVDLAAAGDVAVGDDVVAIGNALALEGGLTVTEGIVSATDRSIETENGTLDGLLQTDAAISSGNSGGALVNAAGELVGINTAVASSGQGVQASNIGFAISADTLREALGDLVGPS